MSTFPLYFNYSANFYYAPIPVPITRCIEKPELPKKLKFIKRPNIGTEGKTVKLQTNRFKIILPSGFIYHYELKIEPYISKKVNRMAFEKLTSSFKKLFEKVLPVYDSYKNVYTRNPLEIPSEMIEFKITVNQIENPTLQFNLQLQYMGKINLESLKEVLTDKYAVIPKVAVTAIDNIMRFLPNMRFVQINKSFFNELSDRNRPIGGGRHAWSGFYQNAVPSHWKMSLEIDMSASAFYKHQPIINFLCEVLDFNFLDKEKYLNDCQRNKFLKEIKGLKIETNYSGIKKRYKVTNVLSKPLCMQTFSFDLDDNTKKEIKVLDYFNEKYKTNLEYVNLPCLQVGPEHRQIYIPIELCYIVKGQRCFKKLTDAQTSVMIKSTAMDAPTRQKEIMSLVRNVNYNNEDFVKEFGIKLSTEMDNIEARILPPPMLQYNYESVVMPRKGAWDMRDKQFFMGSCIKQWAVICFCPNTVVKENSLNLFIDKLIKISGGAGMPILAKPSFCKYTTDAKRVGPIFNFLKRSLKSLQLVVFILPGKTNLYSEIKRVGDTMFGIATQCVQSKNVNHIKFQALANICLKINVKLGGINSIICPYNRSRVFNEPIIFFGIDVSTVTESNRPKLVSVVASMDAHPSKYIARIGVQSNKIDEVKNLSEMVKELLIQFYKETYFKPHRFVFYRQGIPNSKLEFVFNKELLAIREACLQLEQGYRPGITYIFLQKRHHTRLFCKDLSDREGISGNVPAGTIVDQGITSSVEFDFFLCSHSGVQGTSRPSFYHVLWDDNNFSADEIQAITFQLCHTYARCNRSVSIPAPAYYAQLACVRAKFYILDSELLTKELKKQRDHQRIIDESKDIKIGFESIETEEEILTAMSKILKLHNNSLTSMFFT